MICQRYGEWLGDAVDGTLDPANREELDAHLHGCADCRELMSDLEEIRAAAAALDRLSPPPGVWNAIAAKIDVHGSGALAASPEQGRTAPPRVQPAGSPAPQPRWAALAAAAGLMVMLGAAAWFGFSVGPSGGGREPTAELARATSELQLAEEHYLNAIASLEQLTVQKDTALDPATAADIVRSLQSIDRAIDDSRAALESEPGSFVAQTSLLEALRMKVALLQETVSLMNARS